MKINGIRDSILVNSVLTEREMITPTLFIKATNYSSILSLYKNCLSLPQFWKIECYLGQDDDCFKYYSYPGFFFESWLKMELERQEKLLEQNKKEKIVKKNNKIERRRLRNELRSLKMNQYQDDDDNKYDGKKKYAHSLLLEGEKSNEENEYREDMPNLVIITYLLFIYYSFIYLLANNQF